jgi:putative salt-induced outer membrane protein YdiY
MKVYLPVCGFILLFVIAPTFLLADQVTLANGDHLTGEIVSFDGQTLTFKTDYAGKIEIDWKSITSLNSEKPVYVQTGPKTTISGTIATQDGNLAVKSAQGGTETVAKDKVQALRNAGEEAAYEKKQHPGLLQGWAGGANVGFGLTQGNSETENLSLGFTAARTGRNDKLSAYANSIYANNGLATPSVTANVVQGGARYEHDFDGILFGFGSGDFMSDALQALNLRSVFSGGLGYHVIRRNTTTLDFLTGLNYTRESYTTFSRNFAAATLGEEFMHKIKNSTVVNEQFQFFPDFSDPGDYRSSLDFGFVTKINKWFGWQNTFSDIYVTNPPVGKRKNDLLFSTGLNFSFTH